MWLSTRSRYGTRLMLELALNYNNGNVFLKDVAREEGISEKYLSQLVIPLKARGLISATRGAKGGMIIKVLLLLRPIYLLILTIPWEMNLVLPKNRRVVRKVMRWM